MAPILPTMAISITSSSSSFLHLSLPRRSEPTAATTGDGGDPKPHNRTADIAIICAWIFAFILIEIYILTRRQYNRRIAMLEARSAAQRVDGDATASGAALPEYAAEPPSSTGAVAAGTPSPPAYEQHAISRSRRHAPPQHRDDEQFYGFSDHVASSSCRCGSCGDDDVVMPVRVEDLLAAQRVREEATAEKEKGGVMVEKKDPVVVKTTEP